ncbi:hypothetical protein KP509_29G046200 [Ceratopteris richardii]|uniref:Uncharacterized protein n=1 Tax=Ceratopteris richardii TaxID=49495 RepID=A0A8T2R6N3_CERRI|nr:hypothetical protein KP509_29G046200 [Ceratopteris richardii]
MTAHLHLLFLQGWTAHPAACIKSCRSPSLPSAFHQLFESSMTLQMILHCFERGITNVNDNKE